MKTRDRRLVGAVAAVATCMLIVASLTAVGGAAGAVGADSTHSCGRLFVVPFRHGTASQVRVSDLRCLRAREIIRYALGHRLVRPIRLKSFRELQRRGYFVLKHKRFGGFRFSYRGRGGGILFRAHKGRRRLSFDLCWLNVDC